MDTNNVLIGRYSGILMTQHTNNVLIGNNADAYGSDCLVIGDCVSVVGDEQVGVGEFLFDEPIPDKVQRMVRQYPAELHWLIQVTVRQMMRGHR